MTVKYPCLMDNVSKRPTPTFATAALTKAFRGLDPETELEGINELRDLIDQLEHQVVNEMVLAGYSWSAIAELTRMNSKQAAHWKFRSHSIL